MGYYPQYTHERICITNNCTQAKVLIGYLITCVRSITVESYKQNNDERYYDVNYLKYTLSDGKGTLTMSGNDLTDEKGGLWSNPPLPESEWTDSAIMALYPPLQSMLESLTDADQVTFEWKVFADFDGDFGTGYWEWAFKAVGLTRCASYKAVFHDDTDWDLVEIKQLNMFGELVDVPFNAPLTRLRDIPVGLSASVDFTITADENHPLWWDMFEREAKAAVESLEERVRDAFDYSFEDGEMTLRAIDRGWGSNTLQIYLDGLQTLVDVGLKYNAEIQFEAYAFPYTKNDAYPPFAAVHLFCKEGRIYAGCAWFDD